MAQQDAFALGHSNLNGFLFADIGVEGSGMTLSVISALARQGLDPWQEAGRLSKLPRKVATDGLAGLIAAMPSSRWPLPDATAIAARLIDLLPRHDNRLSSAQPDDASAPFLADMTRPRGPWLIVAVAVMMVLAGLAVYVAPAPTGPAAVAPVDPASTGSVTAPNG